MSKRQPGQPIRVLVVEDSRAQRELLVAILRSSGQFTVVGTASTGKEAVEMTARLRPDIVAMDIHLPVFDGYEATRQIMQRYPTPIVMISNEVGDAVRRSLEAQTVGALAVLRKPGGVNHADYERDRTTLLQTLRLMADVPVVTRHAPRTSRARGTGILQDKKPQLPRLLAIASSTGGPAAVQQVLTGLGTGFTLPVLLSQHISRGFVSALADWLNNTTPFTVKIAHSGEYMLPGHVYVPPDDQHILVREQGFVTLRGIAEGDRYCPSGDHLFEGVAKVYGAHAIGVILTGMGSDGAQGLKTLHSKGALTFAQDEASCVVYGMPQAAVALEAVTHVESLTNMAGAILHHMRRLRAS
jgi:two-component system chemotaxis response regulator CheB